MFTLDEFRDAVKQGIGKLTHAEDVVLARSSVLAL